jgi:hypothetical protein
MKIMPKEWQKTRTGKIVEDVERITMVDQDKKYEAKKLVS